LTTLKSAEAAIGFEKIAVAQGLWYLSQGMEHLPFAELVSGTRQRQGLSLNGVARRMHAAAQQEGIHCGVTRQTILSYQRGRVPHPDALRWVAAALGLPLDELAAAAEQQRRYRLELRVLGSAGLPGGAPACGTLDEDVERRELLRLMGRAAAAGVVAPALGHLPAPASTTPVDGTTVEAATAIARSYRRLWATTPNEDLHGPVLGHLRLVSRLLTAASEKDRPKLAAAATDTAVLAAWLAEDMWDLGAAQRHYREARTYAERSRNNLLQAYVAGCKSYWASRTGNGTEAVKAVGRARRLLPADAPPAAHTWVAAREATAYATAHDEPAMSSALIEAEKSLEKTDGPSEATWPWLFPMNDQEVTRYRGLAAVSLQLPAMAVPALNEGLDALGPAPTKRRAHTLIKLAEAHVQAHDVEQACHLGVDAFTMATQLGDIEGLIGLRNVRVQLMPVERTQAVRAFDDRVLSTLLTLPR
jgi:transcriptional regulator with XRE-family HTH domain